jgi:hypothetical protein
MVARGMRHLRAALVGFGLAALALPGAAAAQVGNLVADWRGEARAASAATPSVLTPEERAHYRALFAAIDAEQWGEVESLLAQHREGVLTQVAEPQGERRGDRRLACARHRSAPG